jgi:hypothetical protein
MRVQRYLITVAIGALLAAPAGAQSIKKVEGKAHHELKEAGNGIKAGAKVAGERDPSIAEEGRQGNQDRAR